MMVQLSLFDESVAIPVVNVASVPHRSPFRYPGGKTWLVPRIRQWLSSLAFLPDKFVEPFCGGAIVGLTVAFEQRARQVILVEKDEQIAAVWDTILNQDGGAEWLANEIVSFEITHASVEDLLARSPQSRSEMALQTIVQNRTSHGGILAPGAGMIKHGENGKGLRSRWYPETLRKRILAIGRVRDRIIFEQGDAFEAIEQYADDQRSVCFIDPPYTASTKRAGARLYKYHQIDHNELFRLTATLAGDFLMTYDNAEEVRSLAEEQGFETRLVAMSNTHHATLKELLIGRNLNWVQ
ncbi:MAG: DNA adenine methylase [Anaerolineae bacterium]|nr:DNA adenine methylase [Anaerolineae bacterium]